jgi:hypothetical protein
MNLFKHCKHTREVPSPVASGALVNINLDLVRMPSAVVGS